MKQSPDGMVPARGFLEQGMAPRPSFNDGSNPGERLSVVYCHMNFKSGAGSKNGESGLKSEFGWCSESKRRCCLEDHYPGDSFEPS